MPIVAIGPRSYSIDSDGRCVTDFFKNHAISRGAYPITPAPQRVRRLAQRTTGRVKRTITVVPPLHGLDVQRCGSSGDAADHRSKVTPDVCEVHPAARRRFSSALL